MDFDACGLTEHDFVSGQSMDDAIEFSAVFECDDAAGVVRVERCRRFDDVRQDRAAVSIDEVGEVGSERNSLAAQSVAGDATGLAGKQSAPGQPSAFNIGANGGGE